MAGLKCIGRDKKKPFKDTEKERCEITSLVNREHLGRAINIDTQKKLTEFQSESSAK